MLRRCVPSSAASRLKIGTPPEGWDPSCQSHLDSVKLNKARCLTDESEHPYLYKVGRDSFYSFLASHHGDLFHYEDFTGLYCSDNGRPSVPSSLLATALLLQAHSSAGQIFAGRVSYGDR